MWDMLKNYRKYISRYVKSYVYCDKYELKKLICEESCGKIWIGEIEENYEWEGWESWLLKVIIEMILYEVIEIEEIFR